MSDPSKILNAPIQAPNGDEERLGDVPADELVELAVMPEQPEKTREALRSVAATLIGGYTSVEATRYRFDQA